MFYTKLKHPEGDPKNYVEIFYVIYFILYYINHKIILPRVHTHSKVYFREAWVLEGREGEESGGEGRGGGILIYFHYFFRFLAYETPTLPLSLEFPFPFVGGYRYFSN